MNKINLFLVALFIGLSSCDGGIKNNKTINYNIKMDKFEEFRRKDKFGEDLSVFYPGMSDDLLKSELTEKINLVSDEFKKLSLKKEVTSKEYQDMIGKSMNTFSDIYFELDSEDLDRICSYYEELMDIVGLESSDGHLNTFRYGFNLY
ncbi:hypothetical protein AGMMS50262_23860 [Bacteroidia bacterium]|nr:hypothetical protein AGMMS50262_23860 [Bacteroidia bacterium]